RTTQIVTGLRSVPSRRIVAIFSSSAVSILLSSSLVNSVIAAPLLSDGTHSPIEHRSGTGPIASNPTPELYGQASRRPDGLLRRSHERAVKEENDGRDQ